MSAKTMTCVTCGNSRAYPDGFPQATFAVCWQCSWNQHVHEQHPKLVRGIRKRAKKRARRLAETDIRDAMFGNELDQAIGVAAADLHRAAKATTPATDPTQGASDE